MRGYKAFNNDWTCRGFQYEIGKSYEMEEPPAICQRGFHFCEDFLDCYNYYPFKKRTRIAEVEAYGEMERSPIDSKHCTNKIKILREISFNEIPDIIEAKKLDGMKVLDITLLSVEEYEKYQMYIRNIGISWWLRSPGYYYDYAAYVYDDGLVDYCGKNVDLGISAVRPVLICDIKSFNLQAGSKIWFVNYPWTVIDYNMIICDVSIDHTYFNAFWNDFNTSHIRRTLYEWTTRKGIELSKE